MTAKMDVGISQTGQDEFALYVNHLGLIARQCLYVGICADGCKTAVVTGDCFCKRPFGIDGVYFCIVQNQVGVHGVLQ